LKNDIFDAEMDDSDDEQRNSDVDDTSNSDSEKGKQKKNQPNI